jgi:hypothetical protein
MKKRIPRKAILKLFICVCLSLFASGNFVSASGLMEATYKDYDYEVIETYNDSILIHFKNVEITNYDESFISDFFSKDSIIQIEQIDNKNVPVSIMNDFNENEELISLYANQQQGTLQSVTPKKYVMPFTAPGPTVGMVVRGAHEAYMNISIVELGGVYYDVFVSFSSVLPVLNSSGYDFHSTGTISKTITHGGSRIVINQALAFQYCVSKSISGSLTLGWVSVGGSVGTNYCYRNGSNLFTSIFVLPIYGIIS